jgi:hypothetical protein
VIFLTQLKDMKKQFVVPLLAVTALVLATLACELNIGGPETPEVVIPVSTQAFDNLGALWEAAFQDAQESGQVSLVVNESQLTSLLVYRMLEQEDPIIQDPQIFLRDGRMQIFGQAHQGFLTASVRVVLSVELDENGLPRFNLESADFGPLPVPDELLTGLSAMLDEAFTGKIGPAATGFRIESILIDGGLMAISGRIR